MSDDMAGDAGSGSGGVTNAKQRALLEAAARIIAEEGPEALSMRRLAADVGASTMAVYTWYGSKPNLMRAVFHEAFTRFRDRLVAAPAGPDALVDLMVLGRAYRRNALADPNLYAVMFGRSNAFFDPEPADVALAAGTFEILVDAVARCVDAGLLACDARRGAWQTWAAVHGAMSLELMRGPYGGGGDEEGYAVLGRTVLVGLGADPAVVDSAMASVEAMAGG